MNAAQIINGAAAAVAQKAAIKPKPARVIPDLPVWQQLTKVGGGLTPAAVSARLNDADTGRMASLVDLANALRQKDNHLQGILETRETAVQQLEWDLELPKKPTKQEKKAAEFVKDALRTCVGTVIAHSSAAPFYGYAVTETVWRKSNGYLVPDYFRPVAPRRFEYVGTRLVWNDHYGRGGVDIRDEYPGQFVISQPRVNGDVPCREGLMRVLVWAALFRNWTLTDWLRLGEIAWKPWRIGTYDREKFATQEDIDGLVDVIDAMSTSGTAVVPDSVEVKVEWPTGQAGAGAPHKDMFGTMGREMSKAVLGQTETTESSASSGYAQAKVGYEVKKDKTESDARFIAADLTRDVVAWITLLNFGPRCRVSRFRFVTEETADLKPFGEGVKALTEAGLRMPAKWARDKAGIPEPADGEELLGAAPTDVEEPKPKPAAPDNEPEGSDEEA